MKIGIIGAMDVEVAKLKADMEITRTVEKASMQFCEGKLNGKDVVVDWSVVRDDDGSVVAKDRFVADEPIYYCNASDSYMINLNQDGDKVVSWDPGEYTVILDINADRSVPEAYYLNNVPKEYNFTIK
jgi:hypothetical protein